MQPRPYLPLDVPERPLREDFVTYESLPGVENPGPYTGDPLDRAAVKLWTAKNNAYLKYLQTGGGSREVFDSAGYTAAREKYDASKARVDAINDRRLNRFNKQSRRNDRYQADQERIAREKANELLKQALEPPPPPPSLTSQEALNASRQAAIDAARRRGIARSLIAGDTGGYKPTATGGQTLG